MLKCPSCGFVGVEFSQDEKFSAIGVCECQECGMVGLDDDFETVDDDFADTVPE